MGGAGGHMWHPFDCPDVNSGQDLINFFRKSIEWAKTNKPALKIDGVNLSFRVRENSSAATGYEFVIDRGSMKDLDVQGVTTDTASQRFVSKDPSQPHGMIDATEILLSIFNDALPDIMDELQQLGMLENIGPYSKYFNTEFVLKKINVKEYAFDFIALHSVNDFIPKGPRSRQGVETEYDQTILDRIRDKVKPHGLKKDFRVFSNITTDSVRDVDLEKALNENFTIVYSSQMRDPEEPGELGIGEGSTKSIKAWLAGVSENPLKKSILISDAMIEKYPKMNKKQLAMAKNIYIEVLKGTAINEIVNSPEFIEPVVDGVVVWHATRQLGNAVLDSLESDEFGPAKDQEGVVIKDKNICGGTRFKFTGDFIVGGLESTFEEQKFRQGKLLESFAVEAMSVNEQQSGHVILLPGGFKPPTGGHYSMIKHYEKQPDVAKVFVVTGPKPREGVTLQQSKTIFDIYGGFEDKVEFLESDDPTPLLTCYELMKNKEFVSRYPGMSFSIGASDKGKDPIRIQEFVNYFEKRPELTDANIVAYPPAAALTVDGKPASASRLRTAFENGDWETFKKLLPDDNFYDDVVQVLMRQDVADIQRSEEEPEEEQVNENFFTADSLFSLVDEVLIERYIERDCIKKTTGNKGHCAVVSHETNKQKACYDDCGTAARATHLEEQDRKIELEDDQTKDLKEAIRNLIKNVYANGIGDIANQPEGNINLKELLFTTIMSKAQDIFHEITSEKQEVSEISTVNNITGYSRKNNYEEA